MKSRQPVIVFFFVCCFLYLFILQIQAIWPFTIDDMYITLRYARNWAEGNGIVWNIGEPPVEGYSNFSFLVLARLALSLGLNPVIVLKCIGVLGLFLTCNAIYWITRFWFSPRLALIPCFWLLLYKGEIIWTVSGLETTIYQALISYMIFFIFKGLGYCAYPNPQKNIQPILIFLAGLFLALAGMTRPETPIFMMLTVILLAYYCKKNKDWTSFLLFSSTLLMCFAPYFFWRWHYFGYLFPNPVYCKGLSSFVGHLLDKNYLKLAWPFILLAILAIWRNKDWRHYFLWWPSLIYLLFLFNADPVVAFDNRLFLTAFVLLLPLTMQGMQFLIRAFWKYKDESFDVVMYLGAFLIAFFFIPSMSLASYRQFSQYPQAGEVLRQKVVAWLSHHVHTNNQVVLADCGLIPYLSHLRFIDSYCLNNAEMTKAPMNLMYEQMCQRVFLIKPEVIILTSLTERGVVKYTPTDVCLAKKLMNQNEYCLDAILSAEGKDSIYRYEIFTQKKLRCSNMLENN